MKREELDREILEVLWSISSSDTKNTKSHFMTYGVSLLNEKERNRIISKEMFIINDFIKNRYELSDNMFYSTQLIKVVEAKMLISFFCEKLIKPKPKRSIIANLIKKDQSTIYHNIKTINNRILLENRFKEYVNVLEKELKKLLDIN